jgi:hypothetical protein
MELLPALGRRARSDIGRRTVSHAYYVGSDVN